MNEVLPSLRADIIKLMALVYSGDVSPISQQMAPAYFSAPDDLEFELKKKRK